MSKLFKITINYDNKELEYVARKCDLKLVEDNNKNIKLITERAINILKNGAWNNQYFKDKKKENNDVLQFMQEIEGSDNYGHNNK